MTITLPEKRYEGFILANASLTVQGSLPGTAFEIRESEKKLRIGKKRFF